jgi:hypothetical protein
MGATLSSERFLPSNQSPPGSKPALSIGIAFLLMGLGYAMPFRLVSGAPANMWAGQMAPEVLNLYALTAWMGQAHFIYAFRGQSKALFSRPRVNLLFLLVAAAALGVLFLMRKIFGVGLFSGLVWLYFLGHFAKAERVFQRPNSVGGQPIKLAYYQPVLTFAYLTLVLFNVGNIDFRSWTLLSGSVLLAAIVLVFGGWKALTSSNARFTMLALFFLGECLVWGTYGRYMTPAFRVGVYVFHIAAASYFHYMGSYFFGQSRGQDGWLRPWMIITVNLVVIGLGYASGFVPSLHWLTPLLGIEWFTLWVALHLAMSDLFPLARNAVYR